MSEDDVQEEDILDDLAFADEDQLRHEIKYLRERLVNLEGFKGMFFTLQADLVAEREKLAAYESGSVKNSEDQNQEASTPESSLDSQIENDEVDRLQNELKTATEMAKLSMTTTGEYGSILDFFKKSGAVENYNQLADLVFETVNSYGLSSAIQVRCLEGELNFSSDEERKDLYKDLISGFRVQGRLVEEEAVICVNFENISFISGNFPVEDAERCGRLKDYLVILCSGVDERIKALDTQITLENQKRNLHKIVKATHNAISKIEKGINKQILQVNGVYNILEKKLSESITDLGMSDQPKKVLLNVLSENKTKLNAVLTRSLTLDQHFVTIIAKLEKAYGAEKTEEESDDDSTVDIE
jgi:hypothetical protein